ncbi:MAG TPA: tyrosine-type recombinase/integrase [Novosphingobium sp.]|uniref:Integrase n=1 Tax=Sphingopyxis macrogoltabida TaxID=33050 RepID=A0A0N9UC65_SPHMC|nr:site-specific integrase [Sphingopyxis macrogoltabida]ALH83033.1 integrase [Sphingopyxis macrogoltabida]HMT47601.1 tyrosine-type recombinase/integrase [Novosphingobium sp.]HQN55278.1 tyrosine-type recombinase/integrase [Novosphingobium sp.]
MPEGEVVTVLGPSEARLPKRRARPGLTTVERFVAVLSSLVDGDTAVAKVNFTKALEARSPATLRAMTCDLEGYTLFASEQAGAGLPASAERIAEWIDHLEASNQKPATIARKLATLATVHGLLGIPSAVSSSLVRDAMKGLRRRQGKAQRQAAGLRLGEAIGNAPVKGFTLAALMEACGTDLPGLRDAALLSLGYDAGLRVSEILEARVEALEVQDDGSGLLDIDRSKTDQEGQGASVWVSPETVRRIALWREAAAIRTGPLYRRVGVIRTKGHPGRRALAIADLAYNAGVDRERMAAIPARQASVTYVVGDTALTVAAVRSIIRKRALAAADMGLVDLMGEDLEIALGGLSTHSLRVGLTQDLFASGEDAGPIAQALRWSSVGTALRYGRRLAPASNAAARLLAGRRV